MWKEFRNFIMKGNLIQIAVAFIIAVAFGALVKSFVVDIIMPLIGKAVGNVNFSNLYANLSGIVYPSAQAARDAGAAAIYYGTFINFLITFLIIAFIMFLIVKAVTKMEKPKVAAAPTTKTCPYCKTDIPIDAVRCPHCTAELPGA